MSIKQWVFVITLLFSSSVFASPDIRHWTTENGAEVYFVNAPELPMVDINVVFNAGAARDGEHPGLAKLTNAMLDEGAANLDADAIADVFSSIGANYGSSSQRDMAVVSLRTLTEKKAFDTALNMFERVLTKPTFPEKSFHLIKNQLLTALQAEKQSPQNLATRTFFQTLYGQHPYSRMPAGDTQSVEKINLDDLKTFYKQFYVAKNAVVVIVGDVSEQQAKQMATQLTANLKSGEAAPELPSVVPFSKQQKVVLPFPSSQTTIMMGQLGMSRDDPDYFPLYVGNHILGGSGLVSILSDEIREKRGLTYGVYSYLSPMQKSGPYVFGLKTRNDQTDEALGVLKETLNTYIKNGPTEAQLKAAKQNITGGFALRVDSNSKIADYLSMIGFYGLPLDYLDSFNDKVNAVTVADIKDAFKRRVHADKMLTVLVGGETK